MISKDSFMKLEKERRKLGRLISNALENGISIADDEEILRQSRKVDAFIEELLLIEEYKDYTR